MSMNDLLKAFKLIESNKLTDDFSGSKSEKLINQAEKLINIKFPLSYRKFLERYGRGGIKDIDISGLTKSELMSPSSSNVVWLNLDEREKWNYPSRLIIIADTGDGYWYSLDSSKPNSKDEYPVVIYYDDAVDEKDKYEFISEDFGSFLLEQVTQALEDED